MQVTKNALCDTAFNNDSVIFFKMNFMFATSKIVCCGGGDDGVMLITVILSQIISRSTKQFY